MKILIKVVPNARKSRIVEEEGRMKVYVNASAVDGKANKAVIEALALHYKVKKRQVEIVQGETSREKIVLISDI